MELPDWTEGFKFERQDSSSEDSRSQCDYRSLDIAFEDGIGRNMRSGHVLSSSTTSSSLKETIERTGLISPLHEELASDENTQIAAHRPELRRAEVRSGENVEPSSHPSAGSLKGPKYSIERGTKGAIAAVSPASDAIPAGSMEKKRKSITPSRIGVSGQALRVPATAREARTPGATTTEGMLGQPPPRTSFRGILKKLEFSAFAKIETGEEKKGMGSMLQQPAIEGLDAIDDDGPTKPRPGSSLASSSQPRLPPQTTTKRLEFDERSRRSTPVLGSSHLTVGSLHTFSRPVSHRRVTFGRDHDVALEPGSVSVLSSSRCKNDDEFVGGAFESLEDANDRCNERLDQLSQREGGDNGDRDAGNMPVAFTSEKSPLEISEGTVNSRHAGSTPFNRRLSQLLARYSDSPIGEKDVEELESLFLSEDLSNTMIEESDAKGDRCASFGSNINSKTIKNEDKSPCFFDTQICMAVKSSIKAISQGMQPPASAQPSQCIGASSSTAAQGMNGKSILDGDANKLATNLSTLLQHALEDIGISQQAQNIASPYRFVPSSIGVLGTTPFSRVQQTDTSTPRNNDLCDGVPRDSNNVPLLTPSSVTVFRGESITLPSGEEVSFAHAADLTRSFDTPETYLQGGTTQKTSENSFESSMSEFSFDSLARRTDTDVSFAREKSFQPKRMDVSSASPPQPRRHANSHSHSSGHHYGIVTPSSSSLTPSRLSKTSLGRPQRIPSSTLDDLSAVSSIGTDDAKEPTSSKRMHNTPGTRELRSLMRDLSLDSEGEREGAYPKRAVPESVRGPNLPSPSAAGHRYGTRSATKLRAGDQSPAVDASDSETSHMKKSDSKRRQRRRSSRSTSNGLKLSPTEASIRADLRRKSSQHREGAS